MNKVTALLVSMAFLSNAPLKAQDTAESLVEKTSAKIVKDGGVIYDVKGILPRDIIDGRL